jgi:predicted HicB family RNase H-like nuclease
MAQPRRMNARTIEPDSEPGKPHRLLLRLPRGLAEQLAAEADAEGVSINTLAVGLLAGSLHWREPETGERGER